MNKFITTKEAQILFGKSMPTIRAVSTKLRKIHKGKAKSLDESKLKIVQRRGRASYLMSKEYLETLWTKKEKEKSSDNEISSFKATIQILEKELEIKNKHIDRLIDRQQENNYIIKGLVDVPRIEQSKTKSFWNWLFK